MTFLRHIIFALCVLMVSSSRNGIKSPEMAMWNYVEEYMRETFNFFEQTDRDEFLLILGDRDGESSELSLFLTGAHDLTMPTGRHDQHIFFPFTAVDTQSGVLVIDLPNFDVFHDIYVDLMMAFTHKIILEKAKALKILLVMPDKGKREMVRFWRLAMKLVAILDVNLNDVSSAITLVGLKKPKKSEDEVEMMLRNVVKTLRKDWDFMKDTIVETFGNRSEEWIKHQIWLTQELMFIINEEDLFAAFQRPGKGGTFWLEENRENLRERFFDTDYYANVNHDLKVIVDGRTKDFFSNIDTSEFVNRDVLRSTTKIVTDELSGFSNNYSNMTLLKLFYAEYVSKFDVYKPDANFMDYCSKAKSDAFWNELKFELEKLDFFERLKGENSTLRDFGLDYSLVKEVDRKCKTALYLRSLRT